MTISEKRVYIFAVKCIQISIFNHKSSRVFLTHSLTFFLNAALSSRHITDASIFAAESQFGSLSMDRTDRRMVSKESTIDIRQIFYNNTIKETYPLIEQVTNVLLDFRNRIDLHQVHEAKRILLSLNIYRR